MIDPTLLGCFMFAKRCYGETAFLRQAFSDDLLASILQEMGEVEYTAAISALRAASLSNDPPQLVREAVSHLRSAYSAYTRAAEKRRLFGFLKATPSTRGDAYEAALKALLFMAVCYRFVDDIANVRDTLALAEMTVSKLEEAWIDQSDVDHRWIMAGYTHGMVLQPTRSDPMHEIAIIRESLAEIRDLTKRYPPSSG